MVHAAALAPNARGQEKGARAVTPRRYRDPGSRVRCSSHRAGVLSLSIPAGPPRPAKESRQSRSQEAGLPPQSRAAARTGGRSCSPMISTEARTDASPRRLLRNLVITLAIVTVPLTARAADAIRGRVLDMRSGQGIQKARVTIGDASTITDELGRFELSRPGVDPAAELTVSAVGYGVVRKAFAPSTEDLEIRLGQDAVQHAEAVDVSVSVFDTKRDEPFAQTIQGVELRNLSNVVTDDALRSVQALPGVAASDDLYASFSLRGWGFENTGLYIDGVLISSPFHTIRGINDGGYSLTMLNNDMIEDVTLLNGGAPVAYGDRVGGTLRIETRDGGREKTTVRTSFGAAGASFVAEGPMGGSNTSWLLGARKSFLDYVVQALDDEPSFVVGYHDIQAEKRPPTFQRRSILRFAKYASVPAPIHSAMAPPRAACLRSLMMRQGCSAPLTNRLAFVPSTTTRMRVHASTSRST